MLGNNQTSTAVRLTTSGDAYQPGVVTIATDRFAPKIESTKTVDRPTAVLGDELAYTVTFRNTGQDDATGFVATDPIPENTTYVPGSLAIDGAAQSDAARARRLPVCRLGFASSRRWRSVARGSSR